MNSPFCRWNLFPLLLVVLGLLCFGTTPTGHWVTLNWKASTSAVAGYNVYRATQAEGPYAKLNSSPIESTSYADTTVRTRETYFYAVTAVDRKGVESIFSNNVRASVPSP